MLAQPRLRKSTLPPPSKKRKAVHSIEQISFDNDARAEYLTGFHKRKLQRQKHAQEVAAEKARLEKIEFRKQVREERKQAVEDHVKQVNDILREAERAGHDDDKDATDQSGDEWEGFQEEPLVEPVDREEEYIDEDRYTTVTVESVIIDKDGFHKPEESPDEEREKDAQSGEGGPEASSDQKGESRLKKKKKKFRYESKIERQLNNRKQRARSRR